MIGFADRELFVYDCVIIDAETTQPEQYEFRCYWSPTRHDNILQEVAVAAAAEAGYVNGKRLKQPVSATLRVNEELAEEVVEA